MFDAVKVFAPRKHKGFTLLELLVVLLVIETMILSTLPIAAPALRGYPWSQIGMLFTAVGLLAALAEAAIKRGRRWTCEVMLALGCVLCVASMTWTVHRYLWTHRNDSPIPSVRLTDLTHAHTYCGPGCHAMEVGR